MQTELYELLYVVGLTTLTMYFINKLEKKNAELDEIYKKILYLNEKLKQSDYDLNNDPTFFLIKSNGMQWHMCTFPIFLIKRRYLTNNVYNQLAKKYFRLFFPVSLLFVFIIINIVTFGFI